MSGKDFEKWMARKKLSAQDIAYESRLSPGTIHRFAKGLKVHRSTQAIIENYIASVEAREAGNQTRVPAHR